MAKASSGISGARSLIMSATAPDVEAIKHRIAANKELLDTERQTVAEYVIMACADESAMRSKAAAVDFDGFDLIRKLEAILREELDSIVLKGIMRCGNHHTRIRAHAARQKSDPGRRQGPHQNDIDAHGTYTGGQRLLEHIARKAGILPDQNLVPTGATSKNMGDRPAEAKGDLTGHRVGVGHTAHTVGAK